MTTSHLPRRAVVGAVLAASLIGGGLVAAFAADPAACTTFTDPKGDSAPSDAPMLPAGEDDLDITGVAFDTVDTNLVLSVYVAKLDVAPQYSLGDHFTVGFTHGGKAVDVYAYRYNPTDVATVAGNLYDQTGMHVDGKAAPTTLKVAYDLKASKVVFTVPLADIDKATSTPTAGAAFTTLTAQSSGDLLVLGEPWDDAAAAKDVTYTVGTACGGGAAAPSASASASPSASPDPSASPTTAPPAGGAPAAGLPAAGCFATKDPKGDAQLQGQAPNDPDLDITSLTLGTDAKNLLGYIKVDKLAAGPAVNDGHRFYLTFTFNKHVFTMAGSAYKTSGSEQLRDGLSNTGQVAATTQLAVDGTSSATDPARFTGAGPGFVASGLKFTFDQKNSYVIASLPLADLEKYGKAPSSGALLSGIFAGSYVDNYAVASPEDTAPDGASSTAPGKLTYTVGDNHCFAAAASPLTSVGAVKAQYGDAAAVAAKLVDAAGGPVAGKTITFALGSSKASGVTGADGIAKASLPVKDKAGKRTLTLSAEGAKVTAPFTVLVEKTVLKAAGGRGAVTATLTDDDTSPVAGQVVTFTSGSRKVTARTDAKGVAKASGLPAGNVKVTYAGAGGMYSAAATSTRA